MCGIIGYQGKGETGQIILEALKKMEYRGYDSAGMALKKASGEIDLYKKKGKIQNLVNSLEKENIQAKMGIGHTRWATHGGVTDLNAHPHRVGQITIVHNGIIENASEIRKFLLEKNSSLLFQSETDSEVFASLVDYYYSKENSEFEDAVIRAFRFIKGSSAFVIMSEKEDKILAIKKGAPLICGYLEKSKNCFLCSDPYALVGQVDQIVFPEDNVLIVMDQRSKDCFLFLEFDKTISDRYKSQKIEGDYLNASASGKGEFEHYMLKEIFEQPSVIERVVKYYSQDEKGIEQIFQVADFIKESEHYYIVACGSAWHAGLFLRNFIEKKLMTPCHVEQASEFRYKDPLLTGNEVVIFISQSGETADTLAALEICLEKKVRTVALVNVPESTLYRKASRVLEIKAGPEVGVASTKAFTMQCLVGHLLIQQAYCLKTAGMNQKEVFSDYLSLADGISEILSEDKLIFGLAKSLYKYDGFMFTGRGLYHSMALEGALKLKEIGYVHAEAYAAGELKHGPIALIDENIVNIALISDLLYEKNISSAREVKARLGKIFAIAPRGSSEVSEFCDFIFWADYQRFGELAPLYVNIVMQLLAYYIAKLKGNDVDMPRNLAKSVTVE